MELKELIERAEKSAGSQKELGLRIGQSPSNIRNAKAGIKGLPDYACVMIAELIDVEPIVVIAASNLATEKKEERREIWRPFVARAASVILGSVILNMTPTPSQAAQMLSLSTEHCILCQIAGEGLSSVCCKLLIHPFQQAPPATRRLYARHGCHASPADHYESYLPYFFSRNRHFIGLPCNEQIKYGLQGQGHSL